ncbi:SEC23-interacting protein isoform X2 [Prorops nasuta]|uniref:SEC23-interacting protein isoform X2 n=1 Tax=Prorops nasuta TaxID=863751 RepID=UPI0034CF4521
MSNPQRNIKNPLLSGAGAGFLFDNYAESTFLVPVTPTTPAVLQDDGEATGSVVERNPGENLPIERIANVEVQLHSSANETSHPAEHKEPLGRPAKPSYFSSILSSLPNLSLSSTKNEPVQQTRTEHSGTVNPPSSFAKEQPSLLVPSQGDPTRPNISSLETNFPPTGATPFPAPQPTAVPAVPLPIAGAPISYRLGNQRRLKYAPPPDLTSNVTKQQQLTPPQPPPPTQISTIFNPNQVLDPSSSYNTTIGKSISVDQLSRESSQSSSFRSSPTLTGSSVPPQFSYTAYSEPTSTSGHPISSPAENIPRRVPVEPATPQNTPANFSFAGFSSFSSNPAQITPNLSSSRPTTTEDTEPVRLSSEVNTTSTSGFNVVQEEPKGSTGVFTPVSAAKIFERLEHFLAEQGETKPELPDAVDTEQVTLKTPENILESPEQDFDTSGSNNNQETVGLQRNDSLTDIPLDQEPSEVSEPPLVASEVSEVNEASTVLDSVHPVRSYLEAQQVPSLQSAEFIAEREVAKKTDLNYIPSTVPQSINFFSNYSFNQKEPVSPFFQPITDNANLYPRNAESASNVSNVDLSKNNEFLASDQYKNSASANPHWITSADHQASSSSNTSVPQVPQFYNPAQFGSVPTAPLAPHCTSFASPAPTNFYPISPPSETYASLQNNSATKYFSPSIVMATALPEPTGSATLSPVQMSMSPLLGRSSPDGVPPSLQNLAAGPSDKRMQYRPVYNHWFYRRDVENTILWLPFSMHDSLALEEVYNSSEITPETTVATDGGRYDVNILKRERVPVYWTGSPTEVRRCSWFYKASTESRYIPYEENIAAKLEEEFKQACSCNVWNRRVELSNGEYIIFHSFNVQAHYPQLTTPDAGTSWGNSTGTISRPRVVKRGVDEFSIDDGEPESVDHLLFMVHGIGSVCDLKFRTVEEVVDEFRSISLQLIQSHYRTACEQRIVNRVEVLPISWHTTLHSEATGIDKKLKAITLESISGLRHFTNDTLLDILFYTSPVYCQTIMDTVGSEMNKLFARFKERNPEFKGGVYLGGHSLGSLILFDLLCHQKPLPEEYHTENNTVEEAIEPEDEGVGFKPEKKLDTGNTSSNKSLNEGKPLNVPVMKRRLSKRISYVMGAAGTGQPFISYPQINFHPRAFFALGSPIGMFVTVRGIDTLGDDFTLPTCPAFFNMFHPFDPVAYRVESLIDPDAHKYRPMLIPHHKGRKRMHLELKETMARVGADLKQKLLDSVRSTWNSFYQLAMFHKPDNLEREIDKVVEEQLQTSPTAQENQNNDDGGADFKVGKLNGGRRIDYVLQEAPFECITNYLSALTSHVCYWESEDTILMILKEIYGSMGIQADAQLPQQTLTIERVSNSPSSNFLPSTSTPTAKYDVGASPTTMGMDPTAPISQKPIGPPPKIGFVRKS